MTSSHQLHYNKQLNLFLNNIVNLVRAFPFVILMIAMIPITRAIIGTSIGPIAASLVLSISGLFYFARLVEQNLREVPRGVIEAASAMGASPMSIIYKVLLNEARAGMVSSITVLSISLLSYSAAAGMIGGGGLGDFAIRYGYYRSQTEVIIFLVAILLLLVILIQGIGNRLARKLDKTLNKLGRLEMDLLFFRRPVIYLEHIRIIYIPNKFTKNILGYTLYKWQATSYESARAARMKIEQELGNGEKKTAYITITQTPYAERIYLQHSISSGVRMLSLA